KHKTSLIRRPAGEPSKAPIQSEEATTERLLARPDLQEYSRAVHGRGTASVLLAVVAFAVFPAAASAAPGNDPFAAAVGLGGFSGSVPGSNVGATKEAGEPNHVGNAGGASVWYAWTA